MFNQLFALAFRVFLLFMISTSSLSATTVTWLGGTGSWNEMARWDSGSVPTAQDEVIIPSGQVTIGVGIIAVAQNVIVESGARLLVNGDLNISGAYQLAGINNQGQVSVSGNVNITNLTASSFFSGMAGINNEAQLRIDSAAVLTISAVEGDGLYNDYGGEIHNDGTILISQVTVDGITNRNKLENAGFIDIHFNVGEGLSGFENTDLLRNVATGEIYITNAGREGLLNLLAHSQIENYGTIEIDSTQGTGFINAGTFTNFAGALLVSKNAQQGFGLINSPNGYIYNYEDLYCNRNDGTGIINNGWIENESTIQIFYNTDYGLENTIGGTLINRDYLNSFSDLGINNNGSIHNELEAKMYLSYLVEVGASGSITNDGYLLIADDENHVVQPGGSIVNNGLLSDRYGHLSSSVTNNQLIVAPLAGPLYNGVPFANALQVASLSNYTIGDWKDDYLHTALTVGTYDTPTNTFTPNTWALGATEFYIQITNTVTGFGKNEMIIVDGGVLPIGGTPTVQLTTTTHDAPPASKSWQVFPNPTTGSLQVQREATDHQAAELRLYNAMGQQVFQTLWTDGAFSTRFDLPATLPNGHYHLQVIEQGQVLTTRAIQLLR